MSTVIVHTPAHAVAALTAAAEMGVCVTLLSAPSAIKSIGVGYFLAMIGRARAVVPGAAMVAVLDCGDAPGLALAALRAGVGVIRLTAATDVLRRIAGIAAQYGARLTVAAGPDDPARAPVLDLAAERDPLAAVRVFLSASPR